MYYKNNKNDMICSEYHNDWVISVKKMVDNQRTNNKKINKYTDNPEDIEFIAYQQRLNRYSNTRRLYLFINRTKAKNFSFQPNWLKFWRTVTNKRNELIIDIDNKLSKKIYYDNERKYLMILRTTLQKYSSSYGIQIGLVLHRIFNMDIALVINEYI